MLAKICFEDNAENVVEKIIELIKIGGSRDSHSLGIEKAMTSPLDYYSK
jgi:hypothetical protein